ncbi:MAG: pilus assembly protein [Anaerolineales bacterium]
MMRKIKFLRDNQRGQNFVEIALTLPLLVALLMGMMEIGFLVHSVSTVATAAREGARYGARGMHLPLDEIADVTKIAMELSLDVDLDSPDAYTRIIVTSVDIDPDGSYAFQDTYILGDLDVASRICYDDPCGEDTIDVDAIAAENVDFNNDSERCNEVVYGCRNDLVIVEVFFAHHLKMGNMLESFTKYVIPTPIIIDQQSIMRVLIRRSPWS